MIRKNQVVSWFKELESYKRIDTMCTLIGMCLPFELRFLGSVLEELGRRDSQELRGIELRVNNPQELAADIASCQSGEPTDRKIRRKMAIYLALIRACSRSCVNELFKTLEGWGDMDLVKFGDVENTLEELLLVYTMASLHPVFSYDQRNKCADILAKIEECQKMTDDGGQESTQQQQQQQQLQQQHQQQHQQHEQQTTSISTGSPLIQGHIVAGHQHLHGPMQVLPPNVTMPVGCHYSVPQGPLTQMIHSDGTISHPITVDGIPMIPTNLGIPTEYAGGPPIWALRQGVQPYTQQPTIDQHPPQSPTPMLSQPSSPSHSRTTSPNRSSTNMQQQQAQQLRNSQQHQQQPQQQRNNNLRNSRRPSVETTPPPMQQQQQQTHQIPNQLIIGSITNAEMLPAHLKNLDEVYNPDGTIAMQCRNGYTRVGHHTISRQSKSTVQLQHHNQQQQSHHNQHPPNMTNLIGISGPSPLQSATNFNVNANLSYPLQNMSLVDIHNPIENNIISNRHKSGESDSGNSIGSGDISPPETPALVVNNSNSSLRVNDQINFSKHINMTRLNGRPDKLLAGGLVDGGIGVNSNSSGATTVLYAPAVNSSQQQFVGNDIMLTTGPNLMPSPIASNNNNNNSNLNSGNTSSSNNNLVTNTVMITSPTSIGGSCVVSNVITANPVILQQQQQFSATYPYHAQQHLSTTRPPIIPHNPAIPPLTYRHPGFQISNGEPVYQYATQVTGPATAFLLGGGGATASAQQQPPSVVRSSPSSSAQAQQQSSTQQQQSQSQIQQSLQPVPSTLLSTSVYSTLTVGANKTVSCFNCGSQTHMGRDCHEVSMEDVTRGAIYKLDYSHSVSPTASSGHGSGSSGGINNISSSSSSSSGGGLSGVSGSATTAEIATETSSPTSSSSSLSNSNIK